MAFVWVQQWVPFPVVYEQHMGDLPPGPRPPAMDNSTTSFVRDANSSLSTTDTSSPFYSQLSALPQGQPRQDFRSAAHSTGHYQPQEQNTPSLNMSAMTGALPDLSSGDSSSLNAPTVPRSLSGASTSAVAYQLGHNLQMPGNMPSHSPYGPGFSVGLHQQSFMPQHGSQYGAYPSFTTNQSRSAGAAPMQAPYQNYQQASHYMYYPVPYGPQGHFNPGFAAQAPQSQAVYGRRASFSNTGMQAQTADHSHIDGSFPGPRMSTANFQSDPATLVSPYGTQSAPSSGRCSGFSYSVLLHHRFSEHAG
jgi:hypothetical protein